MQLTEWTTVCKLTNQNDQTYGGCQWGPGVENPNGVRHGHGGLCGSGFYHAYSCPEVAAFLNPAHAWFDTPKFWLAEMRGMVATDGPLKLGATELRTVRELPPIIPTDTQRVAFAIYCAKYVLGLKGLSLPAWEAWADGWLSGDDRSTAAARAADAAAWAAADAAARAAAWAAYVAARAAAWAAVGADAAANAADAARAAAWAAAWAANAGTDDDSWLVDAASFALNFND